MQALDFWCLAKFVAVTFAPQYVHIVLFGMYFLAVCVFV